MTGASRENLSKSLLINTIKPIQFASTLIKMCQIHKVSKCTVLNVSSGDGELVYLNSKLSKSLEHVDNLQVNYNNNSTLDSRNMVFINSSIPKFMEIGFV